MTQNNVQLQNGNGPLAGLRNQIINGDMAIAQRGAGPVTTTLQSGNYSTVDRFRVDDVTAQQVSVTDLPGFSKALAISAGGRYRIRQPIELGTTGNNSQFGKGSVWIASLWSTVDITGGNFFGVFANDGTGNTPVTVTATVPWTALETVGSWTRYYATFTIDASATILSTHTNFLAHFDVAAGSFTGLQIEPGPVATPFEQRPIEVEFALCQRYYQRISTLGIVVNAGSNPVTTTKVSIPLTTAMRISQPSFATRSGNTTIPLTTGSFSVLTADATSTKTISAIAGCNAPIATAVLDIARITSSGQRIVTIVGSNVDTQINLDAEL